MAENAVRGCSAYQSRCTKAVFRNNMKRETPQSGVSLFMLLRSLSKNYPNTPVSAIIEETGVFTWKVGEKMHGMSQSS